MEFGDRLAQARVNKGMTQVQLSERLGLHKFTIAKWEQKRNRPQKKAQYEDLALLLNCRVQWLRDGEGTPGSYAPQVDQQAGRDSVAIYPQDLPTSTREESGPDWALVASIVRMLEQDAPLPQNALGRAIGLAYSLVASNRATLDKSLIEIVRTAVR